MGKDDAYWLRASYIAFGVVVAYVVYKAALTVGVQSNWIEKYEEWYDLASIAGGVVAGLSSAWVANRNKERHEYFLASIGELRKVTWPSYTDTKKMTIVVVVVVGIFAVILAGFDFVWSKALGLLLA